MTTAIWQPNRWACWICRAVLKTSSTHIPRSPGRVNVSPDILSTTRRYFGTGGFSVAIRSSYEDDLRVCDIDFRIGR